MWFGFFDPMYLILVMPAALFGVWANTKVKSTYRRYSTVSSSRNISGAEACKNVLNSNGLNDIAIERVEGHLTDHYDPKSKVIRLSTSVYDSCSVAAIGVACHEAGHAIQHAYGYKPLKIRNAILPVTQLTSQLAVPLIMFGFMFSFGGNNMIWLAYLGLFGFFMAALFQLVTLPTEFDASKRAIMAIENGGYLTDDEIIGSKKVLSAAALTYVAALAVSLMSLLRMLILVNGRSDD